MPTINGRACVANGRNLIVQSDLKSGFLNRDDGSVKSDGSGNDFHSDNYIATNGETVFTFSSPDYVFKGNGANDRISMYDSDKNYLGYQGIYSATQTLSNSNVAYIRLSINFMDEGGTTGKLSDWLDNHRYKLEKGSVATPLTPAPVDKVFSNGKQVYGRNLALATDSDWVKVETVGWGTTNISNHIYEIKGGQTYTASLEIKNQTNDVRLEFFAMTAEGVRNGGITSGYFIGTGSSGIVSYTFTANLPDNTSYVLPDLAFTQSLNTAGSYEYRRFKIERGSVATPWTPAPEDVM